MARVKYDGREVDQNFQIEDGIRKTLRDQPTAEVSVSVIDTNYDLVDEDCDPIEGTFADKCDAIAASAEASWLLVGNTVVFKK